MSLRSREYGAVTDLEGLISFVARVRSPACVADYPSPLDRREPRYVPAFDLVLETAEGDLAGYCMCGIEAESNAITGRRCGYTDPVAVHPRYRRRGGARALLSRGMTLLAEHGMAEAIMNTSSDNARMLQVARSLGYAVETTRAWYSKALV